MQAHGAQDPQNLRIFLTASQAYPAFEQLFLETKTEVLAGFRVFDPATLLRSDAGRAVGKTWSDLLAHTLAPRT